MADTGGCIEICVRSPRGWCGEGLGARHGHGSALSYTDTRWARRSAAGLLGSWAPSTRHASSPSCIVLDALNFIQVFIFGRVDMVVVICDGVVWGVTHTWGSFFVLALDRAMAYFLFSLLAICTPPVPVLRRLVLRALRLL